MQLLDEMIHNKYVKCQKHPTEDLYIYNYTAKAQYDRLWNDCTIACRGLILDENRKVIARPFPKFFNLGEVENQYLPNEPFDVFEKMDGSLGILYWVEDHPFIASRGSFDSDQSKKANMLLQTKYSNTLQNLDQKLTYLFEIIYPENRIVVDYGDEEALVLLGMVDTITGEEFNVTDIGFPIAKKFDGIQDIEELKNNNEFNKEGFVIRFESGYRLKVKFEEYVRIHRIITNISSINIWEYLKADLPFDEILDQVPDEFFQWVRDTKDDLLVKYDEILSQAKSDFRLLDTRKETALYFQTCRYPAVLFNLLDHKPVEETIWRMVKPKFEKPFFKINDEIE